MQGYPVMPQEGTIGAYVRITALSTAVPLPSTPANVKYAVVQCEGNDVRWRADGTNPTATDGMWMPAGTERIFDSGAIAALRFIQAGPASVLNVNYFV